MESEGKEAGRRGGGVGWLVGWKTNRRRRFNRPTQLERRRVSPADGARAVLVGCPFVHFVFLVRFNFQLRCCCCCGRYCPIPELQHSSAIYGARWDDVEPRTFLPVVRFESCGATALNAVAHFVRPRPIERIGCCCFYSVPSDVVFLETHHCAIGLAHESILLNVLLVFFPFDCARIERTVKIP